ncbi:MAG: TraB/GumN family protein [Saprospiraceae bacterium]|nr:TraB/GumN family protein [Saprospiraceae bacterium]
MLWKNKLLFAVGAGHLPGEQGVVALLEKEGYTLTPIK